MTTADADLLLPILTAWLGLAILGTIAIAAAWDYLADHIWPRR